MTASTLQQSVRRFAERSGMRHFLRWWRGQLLAATPPWLLRLLGVAGQAVVLAPRESGGYTVTTVPAGGGGQAAGELEPGDGLDALRLLLGSRRPPRRVELHLGAAEALVRRVRLPVAAAGQPGKVLAYEMDRHTPFRASQVYFDYATVDTSGNELQLDLVVAPRRVVDEHLRALSAGGFSVSAVRAPLEAPRDVNLLPEGHGRPTRLRTLVALATWGVVGLLLAVALAYPLLEKRAIAIDLERQVARMASDASTVNRLRDDSERLASASSVPAVLRGSHPLTVEVIDTLTRVLPDNTWLQSLRIEGEDLRLSGEAASASALIGRLENESMFSDVRFLSSVQSGSSGGERFQIGARIRLEGGRE